MIGIYKITNSINNKVYIGSSKNILFRVRTHLRKLRSNKHRNKHLQASYNKYGNIFVWKVLEECEEKVLYDREQYYLDRLDYTKNYNQAKIAKAGGYKCMQKNSLLIIFKK